MNIFNKKKEAPKVDNETKDKITLEELAFIVLRIAEKVGVVLDDEEGTKEEANEVVNGLTEEEFKNGGEGSGIEGRYPRRNT